jgi:hypothetical protein
VGNVKATYQEVATVSRALLQLLRDAREDADLAGIPCEPYQAANFRESMTEGVALYLYRTVVDPSGRAEPEIDETTRMRYRPPVFVDLHYLLTAWAPQADRQQFLLAWALRTLADHALLPGSYLNSCAAGAAPFSPGQQFESHPEPLSLADLVNIWEVAKTNPQPAVGLIVRAVPIRSRVADAEAALVRIRKPDFATPADPSSTSLLAPVNA